jgi:hypothetical protein
VSEWLRKRKSETESELRQVLEDWKSAGASIEDVLYALSEYVDVRIAMHESKDE